MKCAQKMFERDPIIKILLMSFWWVFDEFLMRFWQVFNEFLIVFDEFFCEYLMSFLMSFWRVLTSFWRVFDEKTHLSNLKCQLKSEIKSQSTLNRQLDIKSYPNHLKSIKIHISSQIILASSASFGEFLEGYWRVLCEFMVSFGKFLARFLVTSWRVIDKFLQVSGESLVSYGHFLSSFWQVFGEFSASFGEFRPVYGKFVRVFVSFGPFLASFGESCRVFWLTIGELLTRLSKVFAS